VLGDLFLDASEQTPKWHFRDVPEFSARFFPYLGISYGLGLNLEAKHSSKMPAAAVPIMVLILQG